MSAAEIVENRAPESCPSRLALDRLRIGEHPGDDVVVHLDSCGRCQQRLAALVDEDVQFHSRPRMAREIEVLRQVVAPRRRRIPMAAGLAVGAAAAAAVLLLCVGPPRDAVVADPMRSKGGLALELVVRHHSGRVQTALAGERLSPGEAIRFRLSTKRSGWTAVVGIDAAGQVTVYHPASGDLAELRGAGATQALPGSIVLDETLGVEALFAVSCSQPLEREAVRRAGERALERAGSPRAISSLDLPCAQDGLWIDKVKAE